MLAIVVEPLLGCQRSIVGAVGLVLHTHHKTSAVLDQFVVPMLVVAMPGRVRVNLDCEFPKVVSIG